MLETTTGSVGMYVYDGHDNPIALITNFSSLAYLLYFDPYGGTSVSQNSGGTGYTDNPYGYAGGIQSHTTQLIKFGARWYDPYDGSWIQQDTWNAPLDPGNGDRYVYASDDPVDLTDPSGISPIFIVFEGIGFNCDENTLICTGLVDDPYNDSFGFYEDIAPVDGACGNTTYPGSNAVGDGAFGNGSYGWRSSDGFEPTVDTNVYGFVWQKFHFIQS